MGSSSAGRAGARGGGRVPPDPGVDRDDQDWTIYGRPAGDSLVLPAVGDMNGDGIDELVGATLVGNDYLLSSAWLISPLDLDGDGVTQLPDVCPLVYDPSQEDSDGDGRGDACATDWDGDGQDDLEDCAPNLAEGGTPSEVTGVELVGGAETTMTWLPAAFSDTYDVSRGRLADLDGLDYGACQNERDPDLSDTAFADDEVPSAGGGYFCLVRGRNAICAVAGSWGASSSTASRENHNPAGCP